MNLREETRELVGVEASVGAHAAAQIQPEWPDVTHGLSHVLGFEPPGEENRHAGLGADASAEAPVVRAPCPAEFFDRQRGIARIQQQCIDVGGEGKSLLDRRLARDVDDLYEGNAG